MADVPDDEKPTPLPPFRSTRAAKVVVRKPATPAEPGPVAASADPLDSVPVVAGERPKEPASYTPKRFRVLKGAVISWYGAMTSISAGDVLDESGYGPGGLDRLRDCGVVLEEVA